jgi:hypothetical protein
MATNKSTVTNCTVPSLLQAVSGQTLHCIVIRHDADHCHDSRGTDQPQSCSRQHYSTLIYLLRVVQEDRRVLEQKGKLKRLLQCVLSMYGTAGMCTRVQRRC